MPMEDYVFSCTPLKDTLVIDVHIHTGASTRIQKMCCEGADIIHTMDRLGVDIVCASNSPGAYSDLFWGNECAARTHAAYPDRIKSYLTVNPHYPDWDLDDYFVRDNRFLGLKVIPFVQGWQPIDDPRFDAYYAYADKKGLPVLFHAWMPEEVEQATRVARRFPGAKFIFGHSGFTARDLAVDAVRSCENVVLDTTISETNDGAIEWLVNKVGADRVVYGTDLTAFECSHILGRLLLSRLTDTEKEKILGLNAKAFLNL